VCTMMQIICEKCNRNITNEDHVEIRFLVNLEQKLKVHLERGAKAYDPSQPKDWDLCLNCTRSLLPTYLIEQKS
jgi:hypothetical protein